MTKHAKIRHVTCLMSRPFQDPEEEAADVSTSQLKRLKHGGWLASCSQVTLEGLRWDTSPNVTRVYSLSTSLPKRTPQFVLSRGGSWSRVGV